MFESLLAAPFTTASLAAMGIAIVLLTARIFWVEGHSRGRLEAPRFVLNYVVREVVVDSSEAAEEFAQQTRDRDWVQ